MPRARARALLLILAAAATPAAATPADPAFEETTVASGLTAPAALAFLPDGRLLVAELAGGLLLVSEGSVTPLATIPVAAACSDFETGLLGMAVDPNFAANGFVYLYRTNDHGSICTSPPSGWTNEVVRVTMGPGDTVDPSTLTVLLPGIRCLGYHNGGGLRIGPDGKLYVGIGDADVGDENTAGPGTSTNIYAQDLSALEGKVLRLNLDGSVPQDNPFVDETGARGEIWAYGFRNPCRFGFDPATGKLWLGDVGQEDVEEVDIVAKGKNYSWPHCEGSLPIGCRRRGEIAPVFTYRHLADPSAGRAVIGGGFAGVLFGPLSGYYFYGDYEKSRIYRLSPNATRGGVSGREQTFITNAGGPVDIVFGPDGALYYAALDRGEVRCIGPSSGGDQPLAGRRLLLTSEPGKGLQVLARGAVAIGLSLLDDPTLAGGTLRVAGTGFDDTYDLPASGWKAMGKAGARLGFTYRDPTLSAGPIALAQVLKGRLIKAVGRGAGLGHAIDDVDPSPVEIVLSTGARRYCTSFGGTARLVAGKRFSAIDAEAPTGCPAVRAHAPSPGP